MKNLMIITGLLLGGLASLAFGQNFTFTAPIIEKQGVPNDCTGFYAEIHNLENYTVNFSVNMDTTLKPPEWVVSFCTGFYCYPPFILSVEDSIQGNGMDSMSVDFTPAVTPNDGSVTMSVYPVGHPELNQSITFRVWLYNGVGEKGITPKSPELLQAYPNPFNASLTLNFTLDHLSDADLAIYDLKGARVAQIFQGSAAMGEHRFNWNPGNLSSGIYLARLNTSGIKQVHKVVYLR